jgi:hypothetical protein
MHIVYTICEIFPRSRLYIIYNNCITLRLIIMWIDWLDLMQMLFGLIFSFFTSFLNFFTAMNLINPQKNVVFFKYIDLKFLQITANLNNNVAVCIVPYFGLVWSRKYIARRNNRIEIIRAKKLHLRLTLDFSSFFEEEAPTHWNVAIKVDANHLSWPAFKKERKEEKSKHPIVCASKKENVKKKSFQTIEQEKLNEHEGENKGGE